MNRTRTRGRQRCLLLLCACLVAVAALAQSRGRRRGPVYERGNVPQWQLEPEFARDSFTFARIKYRSTVDRSSYSWWTDYPDADLNFSWRLHQLTAMRVQPDPKVIELTDKELFDYPFIFMSGVPAIVLSDEEVDVLRRYLVNGGFLMVDDFWGEEDWDYFSREVIQRVFPGRKPEELPPEHPIFHCVFDLKEKPQIPNVYHATRYRETGITWEKPDAKEPHYRAVFDDKRRMMMLICHNTDLGDGWEEEATDPYYFATFSEPKAYPLGINILFYAMTH
ncbi:MAG TPA: DUF4159 domain-containing protein [Verrucomicrobiae bacterium]|nr:DUF4159 domain-containing protein [Verrucomicrobiae bacterium]